MGKKQVLSGTPVEIGSQVFMNLCMPVVRASATEAKATRQQLGQLYAGFIGACFGSMVADFGKEQALAWAQQTIDMAASGDFGKLADGGATHDVH
jgi:hypothetical protein